MPEGRARPRPGCRPALRVLLGLLMIGLGSASAAEDCLKRVFDQFCLAGDFEALLRQPPEPLFQQREGERRAAVYPQGQARIYVMAFRNRIYKVLRQDRPASPLRYQELSTALEAKYGSPQDRSSYPPYATDRNSQVAAIRRGEGEALRVWQGGPGWRVELSWTRDLGIALAYVAEQLDAQRRQAAQQGL